MVFEGHIENGKVVIEGNPPLPEGARVRVNIVAETSATQGADPTWAEVFRDVIGKARGLPADASRNHDRYLYGTPKK